MAGFGFGIGDIIAVSTLAVTVYRACQASTRNFEHAKIEIENLQIAIAAVEDVFPDQEALDSRTNPHQIAELDRLVKSCRTCLTAIDSELQKHAKLGKSSPSKWDKLRFTRFDLAGARARLAAQTNAVHLFLSTLDYVRTKRIEERLELVLEEVRQGRRDLSVTVQPENQDYVIPEAQWALLEDELAEAGFARKDVASHRRWFELRAQASFMNETRSSEASLLSTSENPDAGTESFPENIPRRFYVVFQDCFAHDDPTFQLMHGEVLECFSDTYVDVLRLDPGTVWRFKHLKSSKTIQLKVHNLWNPNTSNLLLPQVGPGCRSPRNIIWQNQSEPDSPGNASPSTLGNSKNRRASRSIVSGEAYSRPISATSTRENGNGVRRSISRQDGVLSRSSSRANSITTEASEYDNNGRLVKSKIVTMTVGSAFFSRRNSAPATVDAPEQPSRPTQARSASAQGQNHAQNSNLEQQRRNSFTPLRNSDIVAGTPREVQSTSKAAFAVLYEKRTQQLQSLMRVLQRHQLVESDKIDYRTANIDDVPAIIEKIDRDLASGSMKRSNQDKKGAQSLRKKGRHKDEKKQGELSGGQVIRKQSGFHRKYPPTSTHRWATLFQ